MKKIRLFLALAAILILATASPVLAKQAKIGHANLQRALNESKAGAQAKDQLEEEAKKLEDELNLEQEALKKMKEDIDKMGSVWNKETKEKNEDVFRTRSQEFQKKFMDYGDELNNRKQEHENAIIEDLRKIVEEIARKKGYSFIFERSMGGILYAPDSDDITDEIIDIYDKRWAEKKKDGK